MTKSKSENKKLTGPKGKFTQHFQAHPKAGAHYSPRGLYRGMTVPYSNRPGQKYLHPERHHKVQEVSR